LDRVSDLFALPSDSYDSEIVREGNDVCHRLNLPEHVRRIVWLDRILWHAFDSDECFFHGRDGLFPARMKGRLAPNEWRPLIASYKMFRYIRRNVPGRVLIMIPVTFLTLLGAGLTSRFLGADFGATFGLLLLVIDGPLYVNLLTQGRKMLKLQADLLAARAEGKEELLSVLRKIQGFGLSDVVETERRQLSRHFSSKPSLSERIHNLELFNEQQVSH